MFLKSLVRNMSTSQPSELSEKISKLDSKSLTQIEKLVSSLSRIESCVESNTALNFNFRIDYDKELWASSCSPGLTQYKKDIESKLSDPNQDLIYRSRYAQINPLSSGFIRIFNGSSPQSVVISDFMMFNKNFDLKLNLVDRLLPYCKFSQDKTSHETYQLDGWAFSCPGFYLSGSNRPHYSIKFDMKSYPSMGLLVTEEEKRLAVRAMIQIMNECDIKDINLNSYHVISEWYRINDSMINSYNSNLYGLEQSKQDNQLDLSQIQSIFNANQLLTPKEIVKTLYSHASNGSDDQYSIYGKTTPIDWTGIDFTKPIGLVNGCEINIDLTSLDRLDLSGYIKSNGLERTKQVIDSFEHTIKSRVNMNNWTKHDGSAISAPELVVEIYSNLLPTGMGVLQWITNPVKLTNESAKTLLEKSDYYIDYLNGVVFKMNWSDYPILDIGRFESRNGTGSFTKCLNKFKSLHNQFF